MKIKKIQKKRGVWGFSVLLRGHNGGVLNVPAKHDHFDLTRIDAASTSCQPPSESGTLPPSASAASAASPLDDGEDEINAASDVLNNGIGCGRQQVSCIWGTPPFTLPSPSPPSSPAATAAAVVAVAVAVAAATTLSAPALSEQQSASKAAFPNVPAIFAFAYNERAAPHRHTFMEIDGWADGRAGGVTPTVSTSGRLS